MQVKKGGQPLSTANNLIFEAHFQVDCNRLQAGNPRFRVVEVGKPNTIRLLTLGIKLSLAV